MAVNNNVMECACRMVQMGILIEKGLQIHASIDSAPNKKL